MVNGEEWAVIDEFPQYLVSSHGQVKHSVRDTLRKIVVNERGVPVITFHRVGEGVRYLRQLNHLVADAFLDPPEVYTRNSIVHLDGNLENCRVDNLRWGTRGEVIEWNRMRRLNHERFKSPPVKNNRTGRVYKNAYECAMLEGKLESEIIFTIEADGNLWDREAMYCYVPIQEY